MGARMGACIRKQVTDDEAQDERSPLVLSASNPPLPPPPVQGLVESQTSAPLDRPQPAPPATLPLSAFTYLDRKEHKRVDLPDDLHDSPQLQESFSNICNLYNDTVYTNREKIDECVMHFKRTLSVDSQLHMRDCFRQWRSRIKDPVFRVVLTDDGKLVKEIVAKANRDNIPQEIWEAQKYIREMLNICHVFLSQYQFLEQSVSEGLYKIRLLLSDKSIDGRMKSKGEELLRQCEYAFGVMSQFREHVVHLMKEIKDSVDVLNE